MPTTARSCGGPEVHSDGEIWAQTLWDLRDRFGSKVSQTLVTRAMELAPDNPSFIDMRNAILVADQAATHGSHKPGSGRSSRTAAWATSPGQSMATTPRPVPSFEVSADRAAPTGTISGTVTDVETGDPVPA